MRSDFFFLRKKKKEATKILLLQLSILLCSGKALPNLLLMYMFHYRWGCPDKMVKKNKFQKQVDILIHETQRQKEKKKEKNHETSHELKP